ncbi:MAG TPA: hypothetical protein PJ990_19700, partial [Saprospiraceae bacterium]|nr:hypothetical protein [Saprospiraceae bacterium]
MRNFISLIVLLLALQIHGQHVGINTQDPQTELDLNGMLRLRPFVLNIDNDSIDIPSGHGYVSLEGNYFNYYNATLPDAPSGSVLVIENKVPIFSVLVDGQFNIESGHHKSLLKTSSGWQYVVDEQYFEKIKENNVSGYRIKGRNPNSFGNIGFEAVDLSYAIGT